MSTIFLSKIKFYQYGCKKSIELSKILIDYYNNNSLQNFREKIENFRNEQFYNSFQIVLLENVKDKNSSFIQKLNQYLKTNYRITFESLEDYKKLPFYEYTDKFLNLTEKVQEWTLKDNRKVLAFVHDTNRNYDKISDQEAPFDRIYILFNENTISTIELFLLRNFPEFIIFIDNLSFERIFSEKLIQFIIHLITKFIIPLLFVILIVLLLKKIKKKSQFRSTPLRNVFILLTLLIIIILIYKGCEGIKKTSTDIDGYTNKLIEQLETHIKSKDNTQTKDYLEDVKYCLDEFEEKLLPKTKNKIKELDEKINIQSK